MKTRTKTPTRTVNKHITVTVTDSFAETDLEASGTVTVHSYSDGCKKVFARVKTPSGLAVLKLSFNLESGWSCDTNDMPCSWLRVRWSCIGEVLAGALAA